MENCACKHEKSRPPGPIKFKLGVCVPHYEYRNPIVFGADPRSFWVKTKNVYCKHGKSRMPGLIEFKLGVCVSHDEYMNPIVLGGVSGYLRSTEVIL